MTIQVSAKQLITAWQESDSVEEVQKKTGLSPGTIHSRVYYYRHKHNIPLKRYRRGRRALDTEELQQLAEDLIPEDDDVLFT